MSAILGALLLALCIALGVPAFVLLAQVVLAGAARRQPGVPAEAGMPGTSSSGPVAVLVPAHDEAAGIAATLATLRPQLRDIDRLLVVADNCSDDTAQVARSAGAEVIERFDEGRRGKGYALDHGVRALASCPPSVVVIVDADCVVDAGAVEALAARCIATGRPAQALYLMHAAPGARLKARIAEFAWRVRNGVRPMGWARLGLPCQLMGSGMAFPWRLIETAALANGDLVEDMRLGLDLAAAGAAPVFCSAAGVGSAFPTAPAAIASQRTRWEHGHLATLLRRGPALAWRAIVRRDARLAAMLLDLCVPPLAALVLAQAVALFASAALALGGGSPYPLAAAAISFVAIAVAVVLAWHRFGRTLLSFADLCAVPGYVLAKVPFYLRWIVRRQAAWVRTGRDGKPG